MSIKINSKKGDPRPEVGLGRVLRQQSHWLPVGGVPALLLGQLVNSVRPPDGEVQRGRCGSKSKCLEMPRWVGPYHSQEKA